MWQLLAFSSAIFSALAAIFEKKVLFKSDPVIFSFLLSTATLIISIPFFLLVDFDSVRTSAILVLYIKSVLGAAAFLLVMYGLKHNDLSNSLPLLVFTPAVVAIAAFYILSERISLPELLGMFMLLIGTYFLQLEKNSSWLSPFTFVQRNKAQLYIIAAIVLFSITSILDKTILKAYKLQPEAFLPIQQFFFTINFSILILIRRLKITNIRVQFSNNWKLILLVAIFAVLYRYSHILALKTGSVALVLSIKRSSVFFATVLGGHYFKEHDLLKRSLAVLVMVTGAVFIIFF